MDVVAVDETCGGGIRRVIYIWFHYVNMMWVEYIV